MSRGNAWNHLLEERRASLDDFFADLDDEPAGDLESVLDHAVLESARRMDPAAGNSPWLDVHVEGPDVGFGALDVHIVDDLLGPIQAEIDAALPEASKAGLTGLELVGVGAGSAVLQLQPKMPVSDFEGGIEAVSSAIDSAIRRVFDVHDAVERQASAAEIASISASDLLGKMQKLVTALEDRDLVLELLWRSPSSSRRRSRITRAGRAYAQTLFERTVEQRETVVAGYVYEQSLKGSVKIKVDPGRRNSATYDISVDADVLRSQSVQLGQFVRILALLTQEKDKLGHVAASTYSFLRILGHQEML
ncbi:hypothetical protein [Saccharothrix hoggarensis]|uniref:Uncharacterized protein n=1 Tax=Saccharothrix hoggarensis TaxID=913853 RepID=A0ABW3QKB6_9PSEU